MRAGTRPNASILEASGRIKWTSDLADIPAKYGVTNVYGDLGTSFANSAVAHPKFAAALLGTMIKGLGATTSSGAWTPYGMVAAMADRSDAAVGDS